MMKLIILASSLILWACDKQDLVMNTDTVYVYPYENNSPLLGHMAIYEEKGDSVETSNLKRVFFTDCDPFYSADFAEEYGYKVPISKGVYRFKLENVEGKESVQTLEVNGSVIVEFNKGRLF